MIKIPISLLLALICASGVHAAGNKMFSVTGSIPGYDGQISMNCQESKLCQQSVPVTLGGKSVTAKILLTISKNDRRNPRAGDMYRYHVTVETGSGKILNSAFFARKGVFIYSQPQNVSGAFKHWIRRKGREIGSHMGDIHLRIEYKV